MGLFKSCLKGGKGFDAIEAGLVERRMLLCARSSAWLAGDRSYSTLEAHEWWEIRFDVTQWSNLFGVGFNDATALVRLLVLPH